MIASNLMNILENLKVIMVNNSKIITLYIMHITSF